MTDEKRYATAAKFFDVIDDVAGRTFAYTHSLVPSDRELLQVADKLGEAASLLRDLGIEPSDDYDWVPDGWVLTLVEVDMAINAVAKLRDSIQDARQPYAGWVLEDVESARRAVLSYVEHRGEDQ